MSGMSITGKLIIPVALALALASCADAEATATHNGAFVYWARERDGKLLVETTVPTKCSASCTPEQAIAATLGNVYLPAENAKLKTLVSHLMYVKPPQVDGILYDGEFLRFDDLLAEVGFRWESCK